MQILDMLREPHGSAALDNLARTFGADRAQTEAAVAAVLPQLAGHIERNTLSRGGLADLVHALGAAVNGPAIDNPATLEDPATLKHGNRLLEQIVGGRDASRAIAAQAAVSSGLSEQIIKLMLPFIASMLMRGLARRTSGGLGDILSKLPQMGGARAGAGPGAGGGIGSGRTGGSFPLPAPAGGSGGGMGGGFGLPGPEAMPPTNNPYGDLSDIIRRGGGSAGAGGGGLGAIVRSILGGVLGFQNRGVMGWIIRLIVLRWGWGFLQRVLSRVLLGR